LLLRAANQFRWPAQRAGGNGRWRPSANGVTGNGYDWASARQATLLLHTIKE
jgi:hypothetical protein